MAGEPESLVASGAAKTGASAVWARLRTDVDALSALCTCNSGKNAAPRTLIVAAHADDEVIGAGARLAALRDVAFVHVTDGSPRKLADANAAGFSTREAYAKARRHEFHAALVRVGHAGALADCLNVADQEAALHIGDVGLRVAEHIAAFKPDVVLTHAYEGGHPDHDATAAAVHIACQLLRRSGKATPALVEFPCYRLRDGVFTRGEFLCADGQRQIRLRLTASETALKRELMGCYVTQRETLAAFPVEFECFAARPNTISRARRTLACCSTSSTTGA